MKDINEMTVPELKELRAEISALIKTKSRKQTLTRAQKVDIVRAKLESGSTELNYHELLYAFEIFCNDAGYVMTVNLKNDIVFLTKVFGPKGKQGFGAFELAVLKKYVDVYAKMYKTSDFPTPTIKGLGQSWIATRMIDLVKKDFAENNQVGELDNETF